MNKRLNDNPVLVLDFDNTLYLNKQGDLSLNINPDNIITSEVCFDKLKKLSLSTYWAKKFLVTGRPLVQKELILKNLERKGFKIDKAFFNPNPDNPILDTTKSVKIFMIKYWYWKLTLIEKLSRKFSNLYVIDDDLVLCEALVRLGIKVIYTILKKNTYQKIDEGINLEIIFNRRF